MPAAKLAGTRVTSNDANRNTREKLAARYRRLADEARALANTTEFGELREAYLSYEAQWRALAEEAEKPDGPGTFRRWLRGIFRR